MSTDLAIGQVAAASGATIVAVRYYADIGLVATSRRVGGKRRFAESTVARVRFIRRCQEAGFSLDEIAELFDQQAGGWRVSVDRKLDELRERRRHLDETIAAVTELRACGCDAIERCAVAGSI